MNSLRSLLQWVPSRDRGREPLLDFLPSALEVERSPPNPLGLWIINTICLLFAIAILWAIFGKIEVVAIADGTIVPGGKVKTIQASELSVVQVIHVQEGSWVNEGDPLITLNATNAGSDLERINGELRASRARLIREQVYTDHLPQLKIDRSGTIERAQSELQAKLGDLDAPELLPFQQNILNGYFRDYLSDADLLKQQTDSKHQELLMSQALVRKAEKILPILTERTTSLEKLLERDMASRVQFLELEQQRIAAEEELKLEQGRIAQIQSQLEELALQLSGLLSEARYRSLEQQEQLAREIAALEKEHSKAQLRLHQQVIRAPIAGTVQELAIHTQGAVLEPAQPLMQLVPAGTALEVQAWVLNKDIGFVEEGQPVTIKVSTFNFTKYGTAQGTVTNLSEDAVMDEEQGYRYLSSITLDSQSLKMQNRELPLRAGMHVVAEVKTGTRNIYEYFTKPIRESIGNSFGER